MDETLTTDEIARIVEEAYTFSFPMLMGYRYGFASFFTPSLPSYRGPVNEIHGDPATLDHTFRDVITPNADTPYSLAALDLRAEPIVLTVPDVPNRYYVMQFEDLYGTNPHFVGSRATGSHAGTYLAVGPRWTGTIPGGFTDVLRFETDLVFLIGRTQLFGPDDVGDLGAIMNGYRLEGLSEHLGNEPVAADPFEWPVWDDAASRDERFIGYVNRLLELCQPPHPTEVDLMERLSLIGIGAGIPFDAVLLDDETRKAVLAGVGAARDAIAAMVSEFGTRVNGWTTIDACGSREFFAGDYLLRAGAAMGGWGGNDKIEALYPTAREDVDGQPLDGDHRYRITLATPPPAKAFWSITMYDTSYDGVAGYLVDNPIGRYLINPTTPGLVYGKGDSLTISVQRDEPETAGGRANWLPSPEGPLYLVMRIYWPEDAALDGTWELPPILRL